MYRMCLYAVLLFLTVDVFLGCAMSGKKKDENLLTNEGVTRDMNGGSSEDPWSQVGKEGRAGRKLEDERDPLKSFLMSDKAQDIERSLGYK